MLDSTSPTGAVGSWADAVSHGSVLAFRFPVEDGAETRQRPWLPCLVLDIIDEGGQRFAVLAPSAPPWGKRPAYAVDIRTNRELARAGLSRPTQFVGAKRLRVSLGNGRFVAPDGGASPLLGQLSGQAAEQMNGVRARICAEADIAADRRRDRREALRQGAAGTAPMPSRSRNQRSA